MRVVAQMRQGEEWLSLNTLHRDTTMNNQHYNNGLNLSHLLTPKRQISLHSFISYIVLPLEEVSFIGTLFFGLMRHVGSKESH